MKLKNKKNLFLYGLTAVFFGVFYYFLPFAGDDWAWGSEIGMVRLKNAFDGYNGRYLGNLLIIVITRSVLARVIFCTLIMLLLIVILSKIFDSIAGEGNSTVNYLLAFSSVLVLVLPNQIAFGELQPFQIFGSTVGWLSGFTNYVVPSVLILIFYYFATKKGFKRLTAYLLLMTDGALACLCVEHYTLFCLLFSFAILLYRFYFYRKICKKSLFFFIGSVIGALIMFSNSSYRSMQTGNVSDHQRAVGFFGSLKQYTTYIFPENANQTLVLVFEIALLALIVAFLIYFLIKTYKIIKSKQVIRPLPLLCLVVMTLPLLFTNSGKETYIVAPRCYFLQYFMLVIYFYRWVAEKDKLHRKHFSSIVKLTLVLLLTVTAVLYGRLDYMGLVRERTVDQTLQTQAATVELTVYPKSVEHIQWASNFIEKETYLERYRSYKNIPEEIAIELVPYEQ
ncbi:MAG: hypothetical protein IJ168_00605 [Eubacterium sp.]|nr:hypothetical protein [Eubacterium sp.]